VNLARGATIRYRDRDVLPEIIDAAHAKKMRVWAWLEFGFSCSYVEPNGGHIIHRKPPWAARDQHGRLVTDSQTPSVRSVGNVPSNMVFLGSHIGGTPGGKAAFIEGEHRPGNRPAPVKIGGAVFYGGRSSLDLETGGMAAGSQFDKVAVAGQLSVGGTLSVPLIIGFTPAAGQSFDLLDWGTLSGAFASVSLPSLTNGLLHNSTPPARSAL
jgi:hypothetical protein